jgi:type II secretory pathway pseudopilin PulG
MRVRDRLVVAVIVAGVIVVGVWVALVSPERAQVTSLSAQITTEQSALATAQAQAASARHAVDAYVDHLHQIDEVIKAVPQVPAEAEIVATIDKLTGTKVEPDFRELDVGSNSATSGGPLSLGLTFTYWTTYRSLQDFLAKLDDLTLTDGTNVSAGGRLFTVTAISLTPLGSGQGPADLAKATVTAEVYVQGALSSTPATGATATTPAVTG